MTITVTGLGTPDLVTTGVTTYTTPSLSVTAGVPVYLFLSGFVSGGAHTHPTSVKDSNNVDLTRFTPWDNMNATTLASWTALDKKHWVYAYIPASSGTVTLQAIWATTISEVSSNICQATGTYTTDGITGTYIPDSNRFVPTGPNGVSINLGGPAGAGIPCQPCWDANNVNLCFFVSGHTGQVTTPDAGSPTKLADSPTGGVNTNSIYYKTGGAAALGEAWPGGSFSWAAYIIELRDAGSSLPPLRTEVIGTPIHVTTGVTKQTYASISPQPNSLLTMCVQHTAAAGALRTISGFTGSTLSATWNQVGSHLDFDTVASAVQRMDIYQAQMGSSPGSGTVDVNFSATTTGQHVTIVETTGAPASGQVVQSATANGDAGTTPAVSLAAFGNANNGTLFFYGYDPASASVSGEGTGFEKLDEARFSSPNSQLTTIWRHSNDTTPDATLPAAGDWGGFALEIAAAPTNVTITPTPGAITFTGQPVVLTTTIVPTPGAISFTGQVVSIGGVTTITPTPGALTFAGQAVALKTTIVLQPGALTFAGQNVAVSSGTVQGPAAEQASQLLTGDQTSGVA